MCISKQDFPTQVWSYEHRAQESEGKWIGNTESRLIGSLSSQLGHNHPLSPEMLWVGEGFRKQLDYASYEGRGEVFPSYTDISLLINLYLLLILPYLFKRLRERAIATRFPFKCLHFFKVYLLK